jgi:hypothetical protein
VSNQLVHKFQKLYKKRQMPMLKRKLKKLELKLIKRMQRKHQHQLLKLHFHKNQLPQLTQQKQVTSKLMMSKKLKMQVAQVILLTAIPWRCQFQQRNG